MRFVWTTFVFLMLPWNAFSTAPGLRVPYRASGPLLTQQVLHNDHLSPLFLATIEATEEAIINSLFAARTVESNGRKVEELPRERVLELLRTYRALEPVEK